MAEATEGTPETTDETPMPEAGAEATADATEEPQTPDVGEALQQLDQRIASLDERLPAQEEAPDILSALSAPLEEPDYAGVEEEQPAQGEPDEDTEALRGLLGEAVNEAVQPLYQHQMQQAIQQRTDQIQAYAKEHQAEFGDPQIVDELAAQLEAAGLQPRDGSPPDPIHVKMVHKAYIADAAASAGDNPAEAGGEGATLETGAGPGEPEPEVDPVEQMWLNAAKGNGQRDAFS